MSYGTGLKVPPAIKKKGRPKGHILTTIGLPAKKMRKGSQGPCTFSRLHTSEKEKGILYTIPYGIHVE